MMADQTSVDWLMRWYQAQCDDDWEHSCGITIDTLDNPGWTLKIDLTGRPLDGVEFDRLFHNQGHETNWWTCWTENNEFRGAGGSFQLGAMIEAFRSLATKNH